MTPKEIGLLFTISGLSVFVMILPAGFVIDKVGRKWATVPSTGIPAIAFLLIPFTDSFFPAGGFAVVSRHRQRAIAWLFGDFDLRRRAGPCARPASRLHAAPWPRSAASARRYRRLPGRQIQSRRALSRLCAVVDSGGGPARRRGARNSRKVTRRRAVVRFGAIPLGVYPELSRRIRDDSVLVCHFERSEKSLLLDHRITNDPHRRFPDRFPANFVYNSAIQSRANFHEVSNRRSEN